MPLNKKPRSRSPAEERPDRRSDPLRSLVKRWDAVEAHLSECDSCTGRMDHLGFEDDQFVEQLKAGQGRSSVEDGRFDSTRATRGPQEETSDGMRIRADSSSAFSAAGTATVPKQLGRVDRYELLKEIGRGGFGTVYLSRHVKFPERRYALKLVRPDHLSSPETVTRFEQEIQAMGNLSHPNVAYATDAGDWNGSIYLVMEYIDGVPLNELLERHGNLSVPDACELVRQAAVGLQHVHEIKRTHRDLKRQT